MPVPSGGSIGDSQLSSTHRGAVGLRALRTIRGRRGKLASGRYDADGTSTNWCKIKNPARHELFESRRCEAHAEEGPAAGSLSAVAPGLFLTRSMSTCVRSLGLPHRKFSINIRSARRGLPGQTIVLPSGDTLRPRGRGHNPSNVPRRAFRPVFGSRRYTGGSAL